MRSQGSETSHGAHRTVKTSIILPVLNAEAHLGGCLESISLQNHPPGQLEVILADGGSTDDTMAIAERWKDGRIDVRIVQNPRRIAEFGKAEALKTATGEFIALVDADNRLCDPEWLNIALRGLEVYPDAFGFESAYLPIPDGSALNNYLTSCLHISDPLAWAAASPLREVATKNDGGIRYRKHRMPPGYPCGANGFVYRRTVLDPFVGNDSFDEAVVPMEIARRSNASIVTADDVGIQHCHVDSVREFLGKRSKFALKSHTRRRESTTWIDHTGWRMQRAALLQMTLVAPFVYSLCRAVKDRTSLWLLHAPVSFVTAWTYLFNWMWIRIGNRRAW